MLCAKGNVEGTVGGGLHNSKTCQPPSLSIAVELHSHHDHKVITINKMKTFQACSLKIAEALKLLDNRLHHQLCHIATLFRLIIITTITNNEQYLAS